MAKGADTIATIGVVVLGTIRGAEKTGRCNENATNPNVEMGRVAKQAKDMMSLGCHIMALL